MRHGKKDNHLGRKKAHREALLSNLASALIIHKRINTTLAKAKTLRTYIEPLVTKAKANTTHARRIVFSYLENKEAIQELFGPVREKIGERPGGYVRVIRTGFRPGDGSATAMIEFVDFNEIYTGGKAGKVAEQKRKTRRGGKAKAASQEDAEGTAEPKAKKSAPKAKAEPKAKADAPKKTAAKSRKAKKDDEA